MNLIKKFQIGIISIVLLTAAFLSAGCNQPDQGVNSSTLSYSNEKIVISGLTKENLEVSVADLMKLDSVTESAEAQRSNGDKVKVKITGPLLNTFLAQYDKSQTDFSTIRFTAKDNYSIAVTGDILKSRDIILGYLNNGEALLTEDQPLRVVIPEERAMYWVRMLKRIDFETGETAQAADRIIFLDTAAKMLPRQDYQYYGSVDKVILTRDLIGKYADINDNGIEDVFMAAGDGLKKNEAAANFLGGYLKVTGEDIPRFLSPDLPEGMHVRDILHINYGTTAFFSMYEALKSMPTTTFEGNTAIAFTDMIRQIGTVDAQKFQFLTADGTDLELAVTEMPDAYLYLDHDGLVTFSSGSPKNKTLNDVISVTFSN